MRIAVFISLKHSKTNEVHTTSQSNPSTQSSILSPQYPVPTPQLEPHPILPSHPFHLFFGNLMHVGTAVAIFNCDHMYAIAMLFG